MILCVSGKYRQFHSLINTIKVIAERDVFVIHDESSYRNIFLVLVELYSVHVEIVADVFPVIYSKDQ